MFFLLQVLSWSALLQVPDSACSMVPCWRWFPSAKLAASRAGIQRARDSESANQNASWFLWVPTPLFAGQKSKSLKNKRKTFFKLGANSRGIKTWVKLSLIILPFISLLFIILVCPSYPCYATMDVICCRNTNVCDVRVWVQALQRHASRHTAKELF